MDLAREDLFECPTYPNLTEFAKDIYNTEEKIETEKARRLPAPTRGTEGHHQ